MAYDPTATTAYAGTRYAPRPGTARTCAQGSPRQVSYITDLIRDLHAVRTQQVETAAKLPGAWDAATVQTLLATLGSVEDAVARQMAAPLVYTSPGTVGTIDTLKLTLTRERAQLRAQLSRTLPVTAPSVPAAAPCELEEDATYRAADGRVIRVVRGQSGHLYGKVWTPAGQDPKVGTWEYFPGVRNVVGMVRMSLQDAQEFGQLTGQCSECQTPLSDPISIILGIGPVCESRYTGKARSRSKAFRASVLAQAASGPAA